MGCWEYKYTVIPFVKVESIGNDFVLVDLSVVDQAPLSALALRLCTRHFSVGSDGLLTVEKLIDDRISMRMFNPDGTEDFCGNGLRCAALYAFERGWVSEQFVIVHGGTDVAARVSGPAGSRSIETDIGIATFEPAAVPHANPTELFQHEIEVAGESIRLSSLSTGSTHTIIPVSELPDDAMFQKVSAALEHHPLFPERTSIIWVREDSESDLRIRIWERGVGETLGCGTGSSAAAANVARARGAGGTFNVHNPGGTVQVRLAEWNAPIAVTGTARLVFEGEAV